MKKWALAIGLGYLAWRHRDKLMPLLIPAEFPGGGRIKDKRVPPAAKLVDIVGRDGRKLKADKHAWRAFQAMRKAAWRAGVDPRVMGVLSAFRDPSNPRNQKRFDDAVKRYGSVKEARKWVAPPEGSAHSSGRTFDLDLDGTGQVGSGKVAQLRATKAWQWLDKNAVRFGFYPYPAEPWHWEYNPPAKTPPKP